MHVPLNEIIKNYSNFSQEELKYLQNNFTHVDFMIYRITKENLMGIEVDGIKYHEQNAKQSLRDAIKDKAFGNNENTLLRIKTNVSNEENRIKSQIEKILRI